MQNLFSSLSRLSFFCRLQIAVLLICMNEYMELPFSYVVQIRICCLFM